MYEPIIIIGAPRSGTNMLRDMLVTLPKTGTWPCDEINYIWRHGNVCYPSDEFMPDMATGKIEKYIRRQFQKLSTRADINTVIEKTCANSLRVGFVSRILPEAKYIFIVRDGIDAAASALKRWKASLDIPYVLRKARYVPPSDLPYYTLRYLINHLYRLISHERRLSSWGPKLNNMEDLLREYSLVEVCALQWKACVENAERDFSALPSDVVFRMKYEEFVADPVSEFARLSFFLNKHVPASVNDYLVKNIRSDSVGKGRMALGEQTTQKLVPLLENTLKKYGYA